MAATWVYQYAWGKPKDYDQKAEESKKESTFNPRDYSADQLNVIEQLFHLPRRRCTCTACHLPPRGVGIPRSFSALAIPVALTMPSARIAAMTGARSLARAAVLPRRASAALCRPRRAPHRGPELSQPRRPDAIFIEQLLGRRTPHLTRPRSPTRTHITSGEMVPLDKVNVDRCVMQISCLALVERIMGKAREYDPEKPATPKFDPSSLFPEQP